MEDLKKKHESGGLRAKKGERGNYVIRYCKSACLLHEGYVYPKTHTPYPACCVSFAAFNLFI